MQFSSGLSTTVEERSPDSQENGNHHLEVRICETRVSLRGRICARATTARGGIAGEAFQHLDCISLSSSIIIVEQYCADEQGTWARLISGERTFAGSSSGLMFMHFCLSAFRSPRYHPTVRASSRACVAVGVAWRDELLSVGRSFDRLPNRFETSVFSGCRYI